MRKICTAVMIALVVIAGDLVWTQGAGAQTAIAVPTTFGEAIVGFEPGALPNLGVGDVLGGLPITNVFEKLSALTVRVPKLDLVKSVVEAVPGVNYVEDNGMMKALATPNDPRYSSQYGPAMMGLPAAWDAVGYGSPKVVVGLVDSGVLATHEDLTGHLLPGHDYVNNDGTPDDTCGHGTHTAGILGAAANNGLGVTGTSQATILPMKALATGGVFSSGCSGSYTQIAAAITDATDQGVRVISMSIGGASSSTMLNAVNYAHNKGVVIVAAAGNGGSANGIDYPGAYPNVIAVGALDSSKNRASYSDGGPQLDVMAPGSSVLSTYTGSNNSTYANLSGTSMATPAVAGAIALALSCAPNATEADVNNAVINSTEDLGASGYDTATGYGLLRADYLVTNLCGANIPPPANHDPVANFTTAQDSGFGVNVNGASSSDPDGNALTYAWDFGDGATATGVTAGHTYANTGTYPISLTVTDTHAATNTITKNFQVVGFVDPDPATPTVTSGQATSVPINSTSTDEFFKILVPAGSTQLKVEMTGPVCGASCSVEVDLYTRFNRRPTNTRYTCRSDTKGPNEVCTTASPSSGWWYFRARRRSGIGTVVLTATLS